MIQAPRHEFHARLVDIVEPDLLAKLEAVLYEGKVGMRIDPALAERYRIYSEAEKAVRLHRADQIPAMAYELGRQDGMLAERFRCARIAEVQNIVPAERPVDEAHFCGTIRLIVHLIRNPQ